MSDDNDNELVRYETEAEERDARPLEYDAVEVCVQGEVVTVPTVPHHTTAYTLEVNPGDERKVVELLGYDPLRVRALVMVDLPDPSSVSAYGTLAITAATTAGTAIASIAAADLPAGRYQIDAYSYMAAGTAPVSLDNLQVSIGGVGRHRLLHMNVVNNSGAFPMKTMATFYAELDGTQTVAVTNVAVEAGTSETHNAVIVATRLPESAAALICHSQQQATSRKGLRLHAGQPGLELTGVQRMYAAALAGTTTTRLSVLVERRSP